MGTTIKRLINLVGIVKGIIGTISMAAYIAEHEKAAFWILVAGAVLDGIMKGLDLELKLQENENIRTKHR